MANKSKSSKIEPLYTRNVQFLDSEGYVVQIPFDEVKKYRVPKRAVRKVFREDSPDGGSSRETCETSKDTGMTGCPS